MEHDEMISINDSLPLDLLVEELEARLSFELVEERIELGCWNCDVLCFFN